MSTAVATLPRAKSVVMDMADRYGMEPAAFERTLRATVFPANAPPEEFAAFLLVAKEYDLNPITKEIYAFPKKGGGIQPIVSIDGWMNLINSHPAMDGMEFEDIHADEGGALKAIRCRIYRKDRSRPVEVTEYLDECIRQTEPWKMKHRMLRHKAAIQCARYAFGFAGIMEPDEAEKVVEVVQATPLETAPARRPPAPPALAAPERRAPPPPPIVQEQTILSPSPQESEEKPARTRADDLEDMERELAACETPEDFDRAAEQWMLASNDWPRADRESAAAIHERHSARFG